MCRVYRNRSFLLTLVGLKKDMCHDIIGFGLIEIPIPYELPMGC